MGRLTLIGGGARSGKSAFARRRAAACGPRRVFIATAEPRDPEMRARITRHRAERDDSWFTVEAPLDPAATLASLPPTDAVVLDCLTLWLANRLAEEGPGRLEPAVGELCDAIAAALAPVFVVSNEVGLGIVPTAPLARVFRDVVGRAHQRLGAAAAEVWFAALGFCIRLRPGPLIAEPPTEVP